MAPTATTQRSTERTTDDGEPSRNIGERIDAAVADQIAKAEMAAAARELRDRLLVEAHDDHGWSTRECARRGHLSQTRINELLARA